MRKTKTEPTKSVFKILKPNQPFLLSNQYDRFWLVWIILSIFLTLLIKDYFKENEISLISRISIYLLVGCIVIL